MKNRSSLSMHSKIHSNDRQYGCMMCDQKFVQKINLINHLKVHNTTKSHTCNECGKRLVFCNNPSLKIDSKRSKSMIFHFFLLAISVLWVSRSYCDTVRNTPMFVRSNVRFAKNSTRQSATWSSIWWCIRTFGHTNAACARRPFWAHRNWSNIWTSIPVIVHSSVAIVQKTSLTSQIGWSTRAGGTKSTIKLAKNWWSCQISWAKRTNRAKRVKWKRPKEQMARMVSRQKMATPPSQCAASTMQRCKRKP